MRKNFFLAVILTLSLACHAQERKYSTFYYQRATLFEELPVTSNDIIFLGNSITNGAEWSELFHNKHIKNRGISGDICMGVYDRLDAILKGYLDAVVSNPNKKLSTAWLRGYDGILNAYLGEKPEKFTWQGKEYTPMTFATDACGLNMDDYVSLTSFTHHPFYTQFALEVEDNWIGEMSYNLPLDELMDVLDKAIDKGYTFSWGSDVSEIGFTRDGLAVVPDVNIKEMSDAEIAKWVKMPKTQQQAELLKKPGKEKEITQELRQQEFDNKLTTDDHGMHVIGKAVDQIGNKYFIVKNSWGDYGKYKGYLYASYPFVAYKTTSVMIHKDALPKDLKKKLGIK